MLQYFQNMIKNLIAGDRDADWWQWQVMFNLGYPGNLAAGNKVLTAG